MDGQPFLVVNKAIDPGLIKVLEHDIVPSLEEMLPNKSSDESLAKDPLQHQFTLVVTIQLVSDFSNFPSASNSSIKKGGEVLLNSIVNASVADILCFLQVAK